MKVSELMTEENYAQYGDIDVYDDYDERCACAWCGNEPTEEGKAYFKHALSLDVEIVPQVLYDPCGGKIKYYEAVVHCENDSDADALETLLLTAAGYGPEEKCSRYFED